MFDLASLNSRCQAQDRATCRYHSAYDAAQKAMATGDMDGFLSAMSLINTLRTSGNFDEGANEFFAPVAPVAARVRDNDIYSEKRLELVQKNMAEQKRPASAKDLEQWQLDKIEAFAERSGLDYETVLHSVMNDETAWASVVMKSVSRQDYYEAALVEHLNKVPAFNKMKTRQLAKSGQNALTLWGGSIVAGNRPQVKTLDMEVVGESGEVEGYVIHKHTDDNGGAQDNQYHDVRQSLAQFQPHAGHFIAAVLDGKYYQNGRHSIETLRREFPKDKDLFIGTYKEYTAWLKRRINGEEEPMAAPRVLDAAAQARAEARAKAALERQANSYANTF